MNQKPADSPYHRLLPIGQTMSGEPLTTGHGGTTIARLDLRPLEPMLVPEPPRHGELDPSECWHCKPSPHTIWQDDFWRVTANWAPTGLPIICGFQPRAHITLDDAPLEYLEQLGPLIQRLNLAIKKIPGVARVQIARWNDGSAHLHFWALARPAGMMQGRGMALAIWDETLPPIPDDLAHEHARIVAESLAAK